MLFLVLMRRKNGNEYENLISWERKRETERKQQSDSTEWMSWLNQISYKFAYKTESKRKKAQIKAWREREGGKQNTLTIPIYMALFQIELLID